MLLEMGSGSRRIYAEATVSADSHSYYEHLVSELRLISQPRHQQTRVGRRKRSEKRLLQIHHRNTNKRKPKLSQQNRRRTSRVENGINDNDPVTSLLQDASYSKNYAKLAKDFVATSSYQVDSMRRREPCVRCFKKRSKNVIFPCEHLCLCNACVESAPKQCPLCNCSVHIILSYSSGNARDEYWKWSDEVTSPLTTSFAENFRFKSNHAIKAAFVKKEYHEGILKRRSSWMRLLLCPRASNSNNSSQGMNHPLYHSPQSTLRCIQPR